MKSYATIDHIEGDYAVCELELIEAQMSDSIDYFYHETTMIEIPMKLIAEKGIEISEWEILLVEHDGKTVTDIYEKSEEERIRRIDAFNKIMNA